MNSKVIKPEINLLLRTFAASFSTGLSACVSFDAATRYVTIIPTSEVVFISSTAAIFEFRAFVHARVVVKPVE